MLRDFRYALRYLVKNRATTALAVLSLALGMMAATSIYSVVHAVILDPFPYKDIDNLTSVRVYTPGQQFGRTGYSTDQFLEIAERSTVFTGVIASTISDVLWTDGAEPQRLRGNYGTANTFEVMGVPPLVGRAYGPADVAPGAPPVAVLGYRFWQRQFGGDPTVVGRTFRLNGQARTVVGVMPKRFMWRGADVYLPFVPRRGEVVEGVRNVHLLARVKPAISAAHAESDLRPVMEDLARRNPEQFPQNWQVGLLSFKETFPSSIRQNLWIMFGAVGLLLLIACANVSNLLLSKATERQREMTIRAALGSGRGATVRQLLIESLLISFAAGLIGTGLAAAGLEAILALVPFNTIPDESEVALNVPVLLFTFAVSTATSVIFGLAPALHATSRDIATSLREVGRSVTGGRFHTFFRQGLVVVEVALSLMLLVAAGLMIRTVLAVRNVDLGFQPERVLTMRVPVPEAQYATREQRVAFFDELLRRVERIPGVEAAAVNLATHPVGYIGGMLTPVDVPGTAGPSTPAVIHLASESYTHVLGIPLVEGRFLSASDVGRTAPLAVVNEAFVRERMEGGRAVGRTVRVPRLAQPPLPLGIDTFEVVGVVGDRTNWGIGEDIRPEVYVPYTLAGLSPRLVVLARGDANAITKAAVSQVYAIDPQQPVMEVRTIDNLLQEMAYAEPRFNLVLFAIFAGLGLLLAVVGVYGVMSSAVAQQVHEMGVRLAIGARPRSIFSMTLARGARVLAAGIALGLAGALFTSRLLASYVWQETTFDPLTFAAVAALLLVVGLQACAVPARRAARVSPIVALRQE